MENEKLNLNEEENNYEPIDITENTDEIILSETVQIVEIDEPELFTVGTDNAFAAVGEPNTGLNHALLHNRDLPDQHIINSVTGLREELDGIHALKTVESDKRGYANYYMWKDEELPADRVGYFVSIHTNDHKISIIRDKDIEVFGVTVDAAGFVGWQEDNPRGGECALVATTGVVKVKCASNVVPGNYIMPSGEYGYATSTSKKYGYYVISIDIINDERYAVISLDSAMNQIHRLSEDIAEIQTDLRNVAIQANAAMNAAASNITNSLTPNINSALQNSQNALNSSNSAMDAVTNFTDSVNGEIDALKNRVKAVGAQITIAVQEEVQNRVDDLVGGATGSNEDIKKILEDISYIQDDIDESEKDIEGLKKQIDPLIEFKNETHETIAGLVASTEDNTSNLAAISQCLSNDFEIEETWTVDLMSEIDKIFYIEDEELYYYYYYDADEPKWLTTPYPSDAGLSETIASMRQKINENEAMVEDLVSYSSRDYETLEKWDKYVVVDDFDSAIADTNLIYYDINENKYYQCDFSILDENPWVEISAPSEFKPLTENDEETIYYAEDTKLYYYYDKGWHTSNVMSVANLVKSIALTKQLANKNESSIENITSHIGKSGEYIAAISQKANTNESNISQLTSYVQNNYTKRDEPWTEDGKEEDVIYYAKDPTDDVWKYWYYKDDIQTPTWIGSVNPADAGLPSSLASVDQRVTENESAIQSITNWQGETNTAITQLKQTSNDAGGLIESLVMNISQYTVGEYSQAYGLTLAEAMELLRDGTVFVPTKNVSEVYDRLTDKELPELNKRFIYAVKNSDYGYTYWYWKATTDDSKSLLDEPQWVSSNKIGPECVTARYLYTFETWNEDGKDPTLIYSAYNSDGVHIVCRWDDDDKAWIEATSFNFAIFADNHLIYLDDAHGFEDGNKNLIYKTKKNMFDDSVIYSYWDTDQWVRTDTIEDTFTEPKNFLRNKYYTWDKTNGIWLDGGTVVFTESYIIGEENTEYIVITDQYNCSVISIKTKVNATGSNNQMYYVEDEFKYYFYYDGWIEAQDPNFEIGALYHWNTDKETPYWQKVATVESNTLNRAISQVRQTANENSLGITNVKGDFVGFRAEINDQLSTYVTTAAFDNKMAEVKLESDANEAKLNLLVSSGIETVNNRDELKEDETSKVFYVVNEDKYYYYNEGWLSATDSKDSNIASKINSAGIITAINNDSSGMIISADKININGYVKFEDLSQKGSTEINGSNIITNKISVKSNTMNYFESRSNFNTGSDDWLTPKTSKASYHYLSDWKTYQSGLAYRFRGKIRSNAKINNNYLRFSVGYRCHLINNTYEYKGDENNIFVADANKTEHSFDFVLSPSNNSTQFRFAVVNLQPDTNITDAPTQGTTEIYDMVITLEGDDGYVNATGIDIYNGTFKIYDSNNNAIFKVNDDGNGNMYIDGNIKASSITIGTGDIKGTHIENGVITTDKIAANSITTDKIAANSITADKLLVGNYNKVNSATCSTWGFKTYTVNGSSDWLGYTNSDQGNMYLSDWYYYTPGSYFQITGEMCSNAKYNSGTMMTQVTLRVKFTDGSEDICVENAGGYYITSSSTYPAQNVSWTIKPDKCNTSKTVSQVRVVLRYAASQTPSSGKTYFRNIAVRCMGIDGLDASMIVSGTFSADRIATGKITSMDGNTYFDLTNSELACSGTYKKAVLKYATQKIDSANCEYNGLIFTDKNVNTNNYGLDDLDGYMVYQHIHVSGSSYGNLTLGCTGITEITGYDGVTISSESGMITLKGETTGTSATYNTIYVTSDESKKTNIVEASTMLDKIRNSGIYSYNYILDTETNPDDSGESGGIVIGPNGAGGVVVADPEIHYGLVIGENYNAPSEVISPDDEHIDLYSMISLGWKGIQELADMIDTLSAKIEALENQNTTEE